MIKYFFFINFLNFETMHIIRVYKIILTFESGIDDNCVRHYVKTWHLLFSLWWINVIKTKQDNLSCFIPGGLGAATVGAVFYGNSLVGSILFFSLSSRWVSLQYEWRAMERYIDRSISRSYMQKLATIHEFVNRVVCRLSAVHASFRYLLIVQETTIISLF